MKTKYEIVKNNIEIGFKERKSIKQGITVSQDNYEEEIKGSYEKAEDAMKKNDEIGESFLEF